MSPVDIFKHRCWPLAHEPNVILRIPNIAKKVNSVMICINKVPLNGNSRCSSGSLCSCN